MASIEQLIASEAKSAGFAVVGFARVAASETMSVYRQWLDDGMAAGMDYLHHHAELRTHPHNIAPHARSIIAVAARYPINAAPGDGVSTYARGRDYHDVIRQRLREIIEAIRKQHALQVARICVDSAPIAEREWAARAGLGWIGKQGQLVNPDAGCCLVLGFILVDLELEPSTPIPNQCGDCDLCIKSCPTGAALGDNLVDARRCVSYLTIEHKGAIPAELEPAVSGTLFGCDCCTAVCPWNKSAAGPIMQELQEQDSMPTAAECLNMTESEFANRFKETSIWRTGLDRLQRNARL
jgi:epoxyqueuosine reductase